MKTLNKLLDEVDAEVAKLRKGQYKKAQIIKKLDSAIKMLDKHLNEMKRLQNEKI